MPDADGRLFAADIAKQMDITASDWRARVSRGHAPGCVGHTVHNGAVRSVWDPQVIADYLAARTGRPGPRPRCTPDDQPADETGAPADVL